MRGAISKARQRTWTRSTKTFVPWPPLQSSMRRRPTRRCRSLSTGNRVARSSKRGWNGRWSARRASAWPARRKRTGMRGADSSPPRKRRSVRGTWRNRPRQRYGRQPKTITSGRQRRLQGSPAKNSKKRHGSRPRERHSPGTPRDISGNRAGPHRRLSNPCWRDRPKPTGPISSRTPVARWKRPEKPRVVSCGRCKGEAQNPPTSPRPPRTLRRKPP